MAGLRGASFFQGALNKLGDIEDFKRYFISPHMRQHGADTLLT
jgi:hypothetical protein